MNDTLLEQEINPLEILLNQPYEPLKCTIKTWSHDCSAIARWVNYVSSDCPPTRPGPKYWCDVIYARYLEYCERGVICSCGKSIRHWVVCPL